MKDAVHIGSIWFRRGTRERVVVVDRTLGGSVVVILYRHRKSVIRFSRQQTYSCESFFENFREAEAQS